MGRLAAPGEGGRGGVAMHVKRYGVLSLVICSIPQGAHAPTTGQEIKRVIAALR